MRWNLASASQRSLVGRIEAAAAGDCRCTSGDVNPHAALQSEILVAGAKAAARVLKTLSKHARSFILYHGAHVLMSQALFLPNRR